MHCCLLIVFTCLNAHLCFVSFSICYLFVYNIIILSNWLMSTVCGYHTNINISKQLWIIKRGKYFAYFAILQIGKNSQKYACYLSNVPFPLPLSIFFLSLNESDTEFLNGLKIGRTMKRIFVLMECIRNSTIWIVYF